MKSLISYLSGFYLFTVLSLFAFSFYALAKNDSSPNEELISFQFQDVLVRDALQQLASVESVNLIISDSVSGRLTIQLDDVSWQQAFDAILKLKGLDKRVERDILIVAPATELEMRERKRLEELNSSLTLQTLKHELISISYANVEEVLKFIKGEKTGILSTRGSASIDKRTNSLLIKDLAHNVEMVKSLVAMVDIPVKQVQIEARIVSINQGHLEELGVRWGLHSKGSGINVGGSIEGNNAGNNETLEIERGLNVSFGVTSPKAASIAFQVANLGKDVLLDLELSALQAESKAEVISSPRLVTTNKTPAYIEQGTEIPYLEAASSGATSVSFKKAVLSLMVTPQITPDNELILDLLISQDRPGEVVKTGVGEAVAIDTQRLETQVRLKNEETIVLGGVFHHSTLKMTEKVPLLADIPVFGALFKREYEKIEKRELLIFVTPKVIFPQ